jgi:hypothetical protein
MIALIDFYLFCFAVFIEIVIRAPELPDQD